MEEYDEDLLDPCYLASLKEPSCYTCGEIPCICCADCRGLGELWEAGQLRWRCVYCAGRGYRVG